MAAGVTEGKIKGCRKIVAPGEVVNTGAKAFSNPGCSVDGTGVGDDYLVSDTGDGLKRTRQVLLFVPGDEADTEPNHKVSRREISSA